MTQWILDNLYSNGRAINKRFNQNWFVKNNNVSIYNSIVSLTSFLDSDVSFSNRVWHILNDDYIIHTCALCDTPLTYRNGIGYGTTCSSKCSNRYTIITGKHIPKIQSEEFKKKTLATLETKYGEGITNISQVPNIKEKVKNTFNRKYGGHTLSSNVLLSKYTNTILRKYGVENVMKSSDIVKKSLCTKYGMEYLEVIEMLDNFSKYKAKVWRITNKQNLKALPYNERRGRAGTDGAYQLDHMISVWDGFINGYEPEIIGGIKNLQFIPWKDNNIKGIKSSITIEQLQN